MNIWDILFGVEVFETDFVKGKSPALFSYSDPKVKKVVYALKNGSQNAGKVVADTMRPHIPSHCIVVPVPASRTRGFNQCLLIAQHFPHADILYRKGSSTQKSLDRKGRLESIHGSIQTKIPPELVGRDFCIIDDVTTTGATLKEAQRALLSAGAASVTILAFAH